MGDWSTLKDYEKSTELEVRARRIDSRIKDFAGKPSLCVSCEHGMIFRRRGYAHATYYCKSLGKEMPNDISECTGYEDPHALTFNQLATLALDIDPRLGVSDRSFL